MIKHQGGCHCGNVRFKTEYDPLLVYQCNCSRCRRLTGTLNVGTILGTTEVEFTGITKEYITPGGSGMPLHLFFCPECGTRVYGEAEAVEGFRLIPIGAYDDSLQFEPKFEMFNNYKMKWIRNNGCVQESYEEAAVIERIQKLMENLDQRE